MKAAVTVGLDLEISLSNALKSSACRGQHSAAERSIFELAYDTLA
jgi:hypothetical protein